MAYSYWHISNGLRGCYMPDSACIVRVRTRRELKAALRDQDTSDDAPSQRAVARLAALAWRTWISKQGRRTLPLCEPYPGDHSYGLFVEPATRDEWKAAEAEG